MSWVVPPRCTSSRASEYANIIVTKSVSDNVDDWPACQGADLRY
jgi:hypothetical protein